MTETTLIHLWNNCNICGMSPITGPRYECQTCPLGPDADFCATCHGKIESGALVHPDPSNHHAPEIKGPHSFKVYAGTPLQDTQSWLEVPLPTTSGPTIRNGFVMRPEFCSGYESTFAGYSFATLHPHTQKPILLTALHVMDEMLRKKKVDATPENPNYNGNELPAHITAVNLYDIFAANWMVSQVGKADRMLCLPGARIKDEEPYSNRDIAAFHISNSQGMAPAPLAAKTPEVGTAIWQVASFGRGHQQRTFKAVVVCAEPDRFIWRYEEEQDGPAYTSGTAIVNAAGEVVGINVGGGKLDGKRFGHGNNINSIRKHLTTNIQH